jgi:hypothetical protein
MFPAIFSTQPLLAPVAGGGFYLFEKSNVT